MHIPVGSDCMEQLRNQIRQVRSEIGYKGVLDSVVNRMPKYDVVENKEHKIMTLDEYDKLYLSVNYQNASGHKRERDSVWVGKVEDNDMTDVINKYSVKKQK